MARDSRLRIRIRIPGRGAALALLAMLALLAGAGAALTPAPAAAQRAAAPPIIRDTEIERGLEIFARPVMEAAGLPPRTVTLSLVQDDSINAFVAGGKHIFLFTGLIRQTEGVGELVGVIAHETGHIAGAHLVRTRSEIRDASRQTVLATLLGVAAAAASGRPEAGMAAVTAGQQFALGSLLAHSRSQESAADAAALSYLDRMQTTARGLARFLSRLADQELLPQSQQSQYMRTHPVTRDRLDRVERHVASSPWSDAPWPEGWEQRYQRIKAKLTGFTRPEQALRIYAEPGNGDEDGDGDGDGNGDGPAAGTLAPEAIPALYGRAIAYHRRGDRPQALARVERLIAARPEDPYFHELKGQILLESSRVAEAIPPLRRAVELRPEAGLIRLRLGHALLETGEPADLDAAARHLQAAVRAEPRMPRAHRFLARALGRAGREGEARLHLAESALLRGDPGLAISNARRALEDLPESGAQHLRARDLIARAEDMRARQQNR